MFAQFAAFLERKEAGDPGWDVELTNELERFFFASYEREVKGTGPDGYGAHAERWFSETGMLVLAGLLPDAALDEPDYEAFRAMAWAATRAEILKRHASGDSSAHERLALSRQVASPPMEPEDCQKARLLILCAGDRLSWTEGLLPVFPDLEFLDLEPTLQWAAFHALAGTEPWSPEAIRRQNEWVVAVDALVEETEWLGVKDVLYPQELPDPAGLRPPDS